MSGGPVPTGSNVERFDAIIRRVLARGDEHPSLVIDIACTIGAEILDGVLLPQSDLNSVDLARRFNTSRTPVREALVTLEKEGLVEIPPRRRPRVADHGREEIREIYQARATLLGLVASEVCERATEAEIAELRAIVTGMEQAAASGDRNGYYWGNVLLHERFTELSGDRTVIRLLNSLVLRSLRFRRMTLAQPERVRRSIADHSRLVTALEERDSQLAAAMASAVVLGAHRLLDDMLEAESGMTEGAKAPKV